LQRVLELARAVRRVDVDEDEADARRRELRDQPLVPVRRPDADAVAAAKAEREQPAAISSARRWRSYHDSRRFSASKIAASRAPCRPTVLSSCCGW
jgi:hypothetical protein